MKQCSFLNMIGAKLSDQSIQAVSNFVQQLPVAALHGSKPSWALIAKFERAFILSFYRSYLYKNLKYIEVHTATRWTIRHGLMLLWFTDLMNVTEEVTIHRPNVSTLLSSAFIRGDLNAATRGLFITAKNQLQIVTLLIKGNQRLVLLLFFTYRVLRNPSREFWIATTLKLLKNLFRLNGHTFAKPKDPVTKEQGTDAIYSIPCNNCDNEYIGQTKRQFGTRLKEHQKAVFFCKKESSAFSEHTCLTNHTIGWDNSKIIITNRLYHQRLCLEAWHIKGLFT